MKTSADLKAAFDHGMIDSMFAPAHGEPGKLVVICGFDGSGKTTQIEAVAERFRRDGTPVLVTRQPTDWYREQPLVRSFLDTGANAIQVRAMALMAAADRMMHVADIVKPALAEGKVVICDRYVFATLVLFRSRGLDTEFLTRINSGILRPDRAFYLDVPTPVLRARLEVRDAGRLKFEERSDASIDAIKAGYSALESYLTFVDGTLAPEAVTDRIYAAARSR